MFNVRQGGMLGLRSSTKVVASAAIGITLLIAGSLETTMAKSAVMMSDAAQTKAEVLKHVPIGMQIEQAKSFMESNGYKCVPRIGERYSEDGPDPARPITRGPADFLWCDSGDRSTWRPFVSKRWQIIFENVGGRVRYVAASVGVTGL
jgi:hypothetical protein